MKTLQIKKEKSIFMSTRRLKFDELGGPHSWRGMLKRRDVYFTAHCK